jgi:hypothetical protein
MQTVVQPGDSGTLFNDVGLQTGTQARAYFLQLLTADRRCGVQSQRKQQRGGPAR